MNFVISLLKKPFQWLFTRAARDVYRRLEVLEYRATTRRYAMEQIAEYVAFSSLPGDYCEFGVYQGLSFAAAFQAMHAVAPSMRFVAFDSFEGLPEPRGRDAEGVPISGFDAHAYASTRAEFERSVVAAGVNRNRMMVGSLRRTTTVSTPPETSRPCTTRSMRPTTAISVTTTSID